jgi:hypothetical protein
MWIKNFLSSAVARRHRKRLGLARVYGGLESESGLAKAINLLESEFITYDNGDCQG